jgi:hypothetical protein
MQETAAAEASSRRLGLGQIIRNLGRPYRRDPHSLAETADSTTAKMPAPPGEVDIRLLERQFPIRVRLGVPPSGLGQRLDQIHDWLNKTCGTDGWAIAGLGGGKHSLALYLLDPAIAGAFVARWCVTDRIEASEGVFQVREEASVVRLAGTRARMPATDQLAPAA